MATANPKEALGGVECLIESICVLLIDAEGFARDGGISDIEIQIQDIERAVNYALADVQARLAQIGGRS